MKFDFTLRVPFLILWRRSISALGVALLLLASLASEILAAGREPELVFTGGMLVGLWQQLGQDLDGEERSENFGEAVALSADGQTAIVGGPNNNSNGDDAGYARVYRFDAGLGLWVQLGADIVGEAAGDRFGISVSLSADGNTAIIGAPFNDGNDSASGHARVFRYDGSAWVQLGADIDGEARSDESGSSVSLSADGLTAIIGAFDNDGVAGSNSGHVRVFRFDGSDWVQLGMDIDGEAISDFLGRSVSVSADGRTVLAGASGNDGNGDFSGHARAYRYDDGAGQWIQLGQDIDGRGGSDFFGGSVSLSADGLTAIVGARESNNASTSSLGYAQIYRYDEGLGQWIQQGQDLAGEALGDEFGTAVSISADGRRVLVGAPINAGVAGNNSGHARAYRYDEGAGMWIQIGADIDGEYASDRSGTSVSLSADGGTALIGAPRNDERSGVRAQGHARAYTFVNPRQSYSIAEGSVPISDVDATDDLDSEGAGLTYSITGIDSGLFVLNSATGELAFSATPDFENPMDDGRDNVYNFQLTVTDSEGFTDVEDVEITVTDQLELVSSNPAVGSADVADEQTITLTFDGNLTAGTGNILIRSSADDSVLQSIAIGDATVSGMMLSVALDGSVMPGGGFYVELPTGVITGPASEPFSLTGAGGLAFSIAPNVAPELVFSGGVSAGLWSQLGMDIDGEGTGDQAGGAVAVSADGETAIVGAFRNDGNGTDSGHARVFRFDGVAWVQLGTDIDGETERDFSGQSVDLSADGETAIIGTPDNDGNGINSGHARIFRFDAGVGDWVQLGGDIDGEMAGDEFGVSVSLSADGETAIIGAPLNDGNGSAAGQARVFRYDAGSSQWVQLGGDIDGQTAGDQFGFSVSISADGSIAAVGAPLQRGSASESGRVRIFQYDAMADGWVQLGGNIDGRALFERSGNSVALSADGESVIIGAPLSSGNATNSGSARIFRYVGGAWVQVGTDIDGETAFDESGRSVSLSADGQTALIGATLNDGNGSNSGHARMFRFDASAGEWVQLGQDLDGEAGNDRFGASVSLSGDGETALVGANQNSGFRNTAGHARAFRFARSTQRYSIPENRMNVTDADATDDRDAEGSGLTYSLSGVDGDLFTVDANTGVLSFSVAPDFENPIDDGGDNVYNFQLTVTDSGGLNDTQNIEVRVTDLMENTPPVITLNGVNPATVECGIETYAELATASDLEDGDITRDLVVTGGPVTSGMLGTFSLSYNVRDSNGTAAPTLTRTVNVVDTTAPVISLVGGMRISQEAGVVFSDPGASASDVCDGAVMVVTGGDAVDVNRIGDYVINYNASDASMNAAAQVSRTVEVRDTVAPVIALNGASRIFLTANIDTYTEQGAVVSDSFDPRPSLMIGGDMVDTSTVGIYTITYDANDGSGNPANQVTRTVEVTPTPVFSITPLAAVADEGDRGVTVPLTFTVARGGTASAAGSVDYSVQLAGNVTAEDFSGAISGTVVFGAGETEKIITVQVAGDEVVELDETFAVLLSNPLPNGSGISSGTARGTITNDDKAFVQFALPNQREEDADKFSSYAFTTDGVTGDRSIDVDVTVDVSFAGSTAIEGEDYSDIPTTLRLSAGRQGLIGLFKILGDNAAENQETISITLTNLQAGGRDVEFLGGASQIVRNVPITDDDFAPVANIDGPYEVAEDGELIITAANGLLANDTDRDDGAGALSLTRIVREPVNGTLSANADGSFNYTPDADFFGNDPFVYEVSDGTNTAEGIGRITVVEEVDLGISVSVIRSLIVAGGNPVATFTVTATNNGPSDATGVVIRRSSVFPAGVDLTNAIASSGNFASGEWRLDLLEGASETLTVFVQASDAVPSGIDVVDFSMGIFSSDQPEIVAGNNTAMASVSVANASDMEVVVSAAPTLNLQSGLFISQVTVANHTGSSLSALRLFVSGFPADVSVHNASGTDSFGALPLETPYLLSNADLAAGASVVFTVEFLRESLDPDFSPQYTVELLPDDESMPDAAPAGIAVERMQPLSNGDFLIEFASQVGAEYAVEYSPDLADWKRATPTITAVANRTQWIDNGPPKTESHPSTVPQRFYRFVLITPAR